MAFLIENIPRFDCLVRKEYTRDLEDGHGEYLEASAEAVMSVRSDTLWFQVVMKEPLAGAAFLLPIEALVTKPCPAVATRELMPWDCFSSEIGVCELRFARRGAVRLVGGKLGEYRFTVASTGNDLADMPSQRKLLHIVLREDGIIGAWPNNRMVFIDRALFGDFTAKPDFKTLSKEFRAEGLQRWMAEPPKSNGHALPKAHHSEPAERPEWQQPH